MIWNIWVLWADMMLFLEKDNTDPFEIPKLGTETLEDPEGYEKVGFFSNLLFEIQNTSPAKTLELDKTYYGLLK